MSLLASILDRIPDYVPKTNIRFEQEFKFNHVTDTTPKTVYSLEKAPVKRLTEVTSVTNGRDVEYDIGSEVELRDTDGDGEYDSVAFNDASAIPNEGDRVTVLYVAEPVIKRYTEPFSEDLDSLGDDLNEIQTSKYIASAEGRELDEIGAGFGPIGRRRGRTDKGYKEYLKTLNRAYSVRGTIEDIKFVLSAVFRVDEDKITITEDYEDIAFDVAVDQPDFDLRLSTVDELLQLTSPTGVEQLGAVKLRQYLPVVITTAHDQTVLPKQYIPITSSAIPNEEIPNELFVNTGLDGVFTDRALFSYNSTVIPNEELPIHRWSYDATVNATQLPSGKLVALSSSVVHLPDAPLLINTGLDRTLTNRGYLTETTRFNTIQRPRLRVNVRGRVPIVPTIPQRGIFTNNTGLDDRLTERSLASTDILVSSEELPSDRPIETRFAAIDRPNNILLNTGIDSTLTARAKVEARTSFSKDQVPTLSTGELGDNSGLV